MKKIAVTSDLHGILPKIEPCDILLICGDIVPLKMQSNIPQSKKWFIEVFLKWCCDCEAKNVVYIAGNHDWLFQRCAIEMRHFGIESRQFNIYYLQDEEVEVEGLRIYGTPWCHQFGEWAFMADDDFLRQKYADIPNGLDILITHDAPSVEDYGVIHNRWYPDGYDAGNVILAERFQECQGPRYHFFGHLHSGDHNPKDINGTVMANVSYVDESYQPTNEVLYLNVDERRTEE